MKRANITLSMFWPLMHKDLRSECEALGLTVRKAPDIGRRAFLATSDTPDIRVCWSKSTSSGYITGSPRVMVDGEDINARSIREIERLVRPVLNSTVDRYNARL